MENNYKLICSGSNLNNFINVCKNENIELFNLEKLDGKMIFELSPDGYKAIKKIDCRGYTLQVKSFGGAKKIRLNILSRIGFIVGFALSVLLISFFNNRIINIDIRGLEYISEDDILNTLKNNNVGYLAKINGDISFIEDILSETYSFSMVSAIKKGNSIIINIKEELKDIEDDYVEITSDYNMIIKSIEVFAGTANVSVGDVVHKNDILVFPYIMQDEEKVFVKPSVKIIADIFYVDKYQFENTETRLVRTGQYDTIDEEIYLGEYSISSKSKTIEFDNYELEEKNVNISNYFLPIKINKQIAYELTQVEVQHNFQEEKDGIVNSLKEQVYNMKDDESSITEENFIITQIDDGYIVSYYLKCSLQLEYN